VRFTVATCFTENVATISPSPFSSDDPGDLSSAEVAVREAFGDMALDFRALQAVSNIFRVATAVRNHMERVVLAPHDLSWSAFVVLFVLRVWGGQESRHLAAEAGITPATLTGVVDTLAKRKLVKRSAHRDDGRRVVVSLTRSGTTVIDAVMPAFNQEEAAVTAALSGADRERLAKLLRQVIRTVDALDG
jgi:MarR family transcriptional regulator, organic hydroperoxide resistance regulator